MLQEDIIGLLNCPKCKGELEYVEDHGAAASEGLVCHSCRLRYAIEDNIPVLIIELATRLAPPAAPPAGPETAPDHPLAEVGPAEDPEDQ